MIPILFLLAQAAAPVPAPVAPPVPWAPRVRTDAASGSVGTSVTETSREKNGRIVVRCDAGAEKVVSVQFISNNPLGRGKRPVSLLIDGGTPLIALWDVVGNGTFISEDVAVTTLTTALAKAREIKLRTTTTLNANIDATFNGPGSDAPIRNVLKACGYELGKPPVRAPEPAPAAAPAP